MALEELGATFIKLGQVSSTRGDLVPAAYQMEFAKLQDQAPPVPADAIEEVIIAELGIELSKAFSSFDSTPIAAASIGQAHAATLLDGSDVVVKIRRPGVVEQVREDLEILHGLAVAATRRWESAEQYDLIGLSDEFARTTEAELDYLREARNAERFAKNFAGDPSVQIPSIHWDHTTSRVMTMERIHGAKVSDIQSPDRQDFDRKTLAEHLVQLNLRMVFDHGLFHADPHPGNFFVEPTGRIGLIDFGMVGAIDDRAREQLSTLFMAVAGQDPDRLVDAFLDLGLARRPIDRTRLQRDLSDVVAKYYGKPLGELGVGGLLAHIQNTFRTHYLQFPTNLALLTKTWIMLEGLVTKLDPACSMAEQFVPYVKRLIQDQYSTSVWLKRIQDASTDAIRLGTELPRQAHRLLGQLERGTLEINARPIGFERILERLDTLATRVTVSVIAGAFINALAVLTLYYHPAGWQAWVGLSFAFGVAAATALGAYLAWNIMHSRRN